MRRSTPPSSNFFWKVSRRKSPKPPQEKKDTLHQAYFQTQTVDPKRYDSMILLLETFADQLSSQADNLVIVLDGSEPEAIAKARRLIHAKLDEPVSLHDLAATAGLSESHFCRTFKEVTKLTVTEYVTRARINIAKKQLLRPAIRVSDIAFEAGFQSLSKFNRSFARILGCSPTKYREEQLAEANINA